MPTITIGIQSSTRPASSRNTIPTASADPEQDQRQRERAELLDLDATDAVVAFLDPDEQVLERAAPAAPAHWAE